MLHTGLQGPVQVRALGQGKLGSQWPRPRQPQPRPRQCQQIAAGARGADNWHPPQPSLSGAHVWAARHCCVTASPSVDPAR